MASYLQEAFPPSVKISLILNVPTTLGTYGFGIWATHIVYVYTGVSASGSCNLPFIVTLLTTDMIISLIVATLFCLLISYAIVTTRVHKLYFVLTIVNVMRSLYSGLLSLGLNIAITVYFYSGQCLSSCPDLNPYLITYWVCFMLGVLTAIICFILLIYVRWFLNTEESMLPLY
jgi:hypothetical protein